MNNIGANIGGGSASDPGMGGGDTTVYMELRVLQVGIAPAPSNVMKTKHDTAKSSIRNVR